MTIVVYTKVNTTMSSGGSNTTCFRPTKKEKITTVLCKFKRGKNMKNNDLLMNGEKQPKPTSASINKPKRVTQLKVSTRMLNDLTDPPLPEPIKEEVQHPITMVGEAQAHEEVQPPPVEEVQEEVPEDPPRETPEEATEEGEEKEDKETRTMAPRIQAGRIRAKKTDPTTTVRAKRRGVVCRSKV